MTDYAASHAESDYQQYLQDISVPTGDKHARLQLQSPSPDMKLVREGFEQGRNSPEDIDRMARLFRRFGHVSYMSRAIAVWTEAYRYIDQLRSLGEDLHREINSDHPNAQKIETITNQIAIVDAQVTPLEDEFSSTLSQGARRIDWVLSIAILLASGLLLLIGIGLSSAVLNQVRASEEKYRNLIDTASDGILVIDAQTRVVLEANNQTCEMLSIPEHELVGLPESRLYPAKGMEGSGGDHLIGERQARSATPLKVEVRGVFFVSGQLRTQKIFERDQSGRNTGFVDRREGSDLIRKRLP